MTLRKIEMTVLLGKSKMRLRQLVASCLSLTVLAAPAVAQDSFQAYTMWLGTDRPLGILGGGPLDTLAWLTPEAEGDGDRWVQREDGPFLRFSTEAAGPDMCLDVVNGGPFDHFVGLAACGDFSGQLWTVREEESWLRLTNEFLGPDMCLDVFNGGPLHGMAVMAPCGDFSGQLWQMN